MKWEETVRGIRPVDNQAAQKAAAHWDRVAKPLNSLGVLEEDLIRIAAVQGQESISLDHKWIAVMCADNGIVEEGVTQTGQEVTAIVAANMGKGVSSVCLMAKEAGAGVFPVDAGMACEGTPKGVLPRKIRRGSRNFLKGPAMTREETAAALEIGIETAGILKERGCCLAGSGEMGIGNTTTSSAVTAALLEVSPDLVTGVGAGLSPEGYQRKVEVITQALKTHRPDPRDAVGVLSAVGGFDLAALAGFYLGCGFYRIPVVLDGLITGAAALAAVRICPEVKGYLLASHVSAEPAGRLILGELGLKAAIQAGMCLGEGTGAAALFPLLDMAHRVYREMGSFEEIRVEPYQRFERRDI